MSATVVKSPTPKTKNLVATKLTESKGMDKEKLEIKKEMSKIKEESKILKERVLELEKEKKKLSLDYTIKAEELVRFKLDSAENKVKFDMMSSIKIYREDIVKVDKIIRDFLMEELISYSTELAEEVAEKEPEMDLKKKGEKKVKVLTSKYENLETSIANTSCACSTCTMVKGMSMSSVLGFKTNNITTKMLKMSKGFEMSIHFPSSKYRYINNKTNMESLVKTIHLVNDRSSTDKITINLFKKTTRVTNSNSINFGEHNIIPIIFNGVDIMVSPASMMLVTMMRSVTNKNPRASYTYEDLITSEGSRCFSNTVNKLMGFDLINESVCRISDMTEDQEMIFCSHSSFLSVHISSDIKDGPECMNNHMDTEMFENSVEIPLFSLVSPMLRFTPFFASNEEDFAPDGLLDYDDTMEDQEVTEGDFDGISSEFTNLMVENDAFIEDKKKEALVSKAAVTEKDVEEMERIQKALVRDNRRLDAWLMMTMNERKSFLEDKVIDLQMHDDSGKIFRNVFNTKLMSQSTEESYTREQLEEEMGIDMYPPDDPTETSSARLSSYGNYMLAQVTVYDTMLLLSKYGELDILENTQKDLLVSRLAKAYLYTSLKNLDELFLFHVSYRVFLAFCYMYSDDTKLVSLVLNGTFESLIEKIVALPYYYYSEFKDRFTLDINEANFESMFTTFLNFLEDKFTYKDTFYRTLYKSLKERVHSFILLKSDALKMETTSKEDMFNEVKKKEEHQMLYTNWSLKNVYTLWKEKLDKPNFEDFVGPKSKNFINPKILKSIFSRMTKDSIVYEFGALEHLSTCMLDFPFQEGADIKNKARVSSASRMSKMM